MKREAKVAWPKAHEFTNAVISAVRSGNNISHEQLLSAVNDPDGMKVFDPGAHQALAKSDHVVFQYGIYLQRSSGEIAIFERARMEQGGKRMNAGRSLLVSRSAPAPPYYAVPRSLQHEVCTGGIKRIGRLTPIGMAINPMPPLHGTPRPFYLFALFRNEFPDELPMHGRFRTSPDKFVGWIHPKDFGKHFSFSGAVDQLLSKQLVAQAFSPIDGGDDDISFSPASRLTEAGNSPDSFEPANYTSGKNVFVSHAAEDAFSAYALFRMLVDESSRSIYPTIDLEDLKDGQKITKIDALIDEADCIVLVITPNLIRKSEEKRAAGEKDWVRYEVERAEKSGKPIIGFKLGTMSVPYYVSDDLVSNSRSFYADWLKEVAGLIDRIHERYSQ